MMVAKLELKLNKMSMLMMVMVSYVLLFALRLLFSVLATSWLLLLLIGYFISLFNLLLNTITWCPPFTFTQSFEPAYVAPIYANYPSK